MVGTKRIVKISGIGLLAAFMALAFSSAGVVLNSKTASASSETCTTKGYSYIGSQKMYLGKADGSSVQTGTLSVYYKSSTGKNCAMAWCYDWTCYSMYRTVAIKPSNHAKWDDVDAGYFQNWAGPVETTSSTRGQCIDIYAQARPHQSSPQGQMGETYINNKFCG